MTASSRFQRIEAIANKHINQGSISGVEWLVKRKGEVWAAMGNTHSASAIFI